DGLPIILLADRQTTGGYTKIATIISVDIPKVAQAKPGDSIKFQQVKGAQAVALRQKYELQIEAIKSLLRP
ncbi:MAG: KipI antagonist, partial [Chloroflexi bacterium]|nr:KipI antagonist [Chloroflexota bacterium]